MTHNYKYFYALLSQMPNPGGMEPEEMKEMLVLQFTNNRTAHIGDMKKIEFAEMTTAMAEKINLAKYGDCDKWRKRVMASVGAWLKALNKESNMQQIIGIACRAAGKYKRFNDIPASRLRDVYYEFVRKRKVIENATDITEAITAELEMMN